MSDVQTIHPVSIELTKPTKNKFFKPAQKVKYISPNEDNIPSGIYDVLEEWVGMSRKQPKVCLYYKIALEKGSQSVLQSDCVVLE